MVAALRKFLVVLFSVVSIGTSAEELCSNDGKARMKAANVSDVQIEKICSGKVPATAAPAVDYTDLKVLLLDAGNDVSPIGKTVRLNGFFRKITLRYGEPVMLVNVRNSGTSLNLWEVHFSNRWNPVIRNLNEDNKLTVTCTILKITGAISMCDLVHLSAQ